MDFMFDGDWDVLDEDMDIAHNRDQWVAEPIPLLEEVDGKMTFQSKNLRKLLNPDILKDTPVAFVSIAGALRKGKSFFLNLMLRFLENKGWEKNSKWLDDWNSTNDHGLKWHGGAKAHTRGIVAWGKPIFIERYDSRREIAVVLLDTQGNFEHGRSMDENIKVFALSTLLSSLQIFNIDKQIQTNDLDYLQCFVEFGKMMAPVTKRHTVVDSGRSESDRRRVFQDLAFLVRDWPNPVDYHYGYGGGKEYLENFKLVQKGTQNQNEVQKYLAETFQCQTCFLMPEPGPDVRISKEKDRILTKKDLGVDFCHYLNVFAETYLHPHKVPIKTINQLDNATAAELIEYMETCADALINDNRLDIPNLMKLVANNNRENAMKKAQKTFITYLAEGIKQMEEPSWEEFSKLTEREEKNVKDEFRYHTQYGEDDDDETVGPLVERLRWAQNEVKPQMRDRRTAFAKDMLKRWLEESKEKMQDYRGYFYTNPDELLEIKNDCLALRIKKHKEDNDDFDKALKDAEVELEAWTNERMRSETGSNWKRVTSGMKALGVGAAVATTVGTGGIFLAGASLLAAGSAAASAGILTAGRYLKGAYDELQNKRRSSTKTD